MLPCLLSNLSDGLAAPSNDGADHFRLDEDSEWKVDCPLIKRKLISIFRKTSEFYHMCNNLSKCRKTI